MLESHHQARNILKMLGVAKVWLLVIQSNRKLRNNNSPCCDANIAVDYGKSNRYLEILLHSISCSKAKYKTASNLRCFGKVRVQF